MARSKDSVNLSELQEVINDLEAKQVYNSPYRLLIAVAETEWAARNNMTQSKIYSLVREANEDPENLGIIMKTQSPRGRGPKPRGEGRAPRRSAASASKALSASFSGWDLLVNAFQARGVEVTDVRSIMTANFRSQEENRARLLAWGDLRRVLGCTSTKKPGAGDESVPVGQDGDQAVAVRDEVLESVQATMGSTEVLEVVETDPAGRVIEGPVPPAPIPVSPPIDTFLEATDELGAIKQVQPLVVSRPQPIASSVAPRPQPVAAQKPVTPAQMAWKNASSK